MLIFLRKMSNVIPQNTKYICFTTSRFTHTGMSNFIFAQVRVQILDYYVSQVEVKRRFNEYRKINWFSVFVFRSVTPNTKFEQKDNERAPFQTENRKAAGSTDGSGAGLSGAGPRSLSSSSTKSRS